MGDLMSATSIVLALNLSISGMLALAFFFISRLSPVAASARWISFGYVLAMLNVGLELAGHYVLNATFIYLMVYACLTGAMISLNIAMAQKYRLPIPIYQLAFLSLLALCTFLLTAGMEFDTTIRQMIYHVPFTLLLARAGLTLWKVPNKALLDKTLTVTLFLGALNFFSKPFIAEFLGTGGSSFLDYLNTSYALISQSLSGFLGVALAILTLLIFTRDMLEEIARRSEQEPFPGVLEKHVFDAQLGEYFTNERPDTPFALVCCDLDQLRTINGIFGRPAGNLLLAALARQLGVTSYAGQIIGQTISKEFMVLLPQANLAVAQLFAETVRKAFSNSHIPGAPPGRNFTASFGVTEYLAGDDVNDLISRAETALYKAKMDGHDCVRFTLVKADPSLGPSRAPAERIIELPS